VFVLAIAFSLLPASIISFLCFERERGLKHLQLISGMSLSSYWTVNYAFDMLRAFILVAGSIGLIYQYKLGIQDVWIALLAYPIAIVPHTYVASFFFTKEGTSQNFTLFINMFFAALLAIGVFVMRFVREAEQLGDLLSYIFKVVPSFAISDSLLYSFNREDLNKTRNYTEADIWLAEYQN
jgi:ATP-binding cassette subfamily A (ABC1) protein 3